MPFFRPLTIFLSTFAVAVAIADEPKPSSRIVRDLVYASPAGQALQCDVFSPAGRGRFPVTLVIHGGAWSSGSKTVMGGFAAKLAENGIAAVAINYRHAPEYKFPAQVDDVREALLWIHDNADNYHFDTARIGLFGYSAGGHLACMIATLQDESPDRVLTTSDWPANDDRWKRLPQIAACVAGGPPCDFQQLPPQNTGMTFFLGATRGERPDVYRAASPLSFSSAGDCPILFIHGERDFVVPITSSRSLYDSQLAFGVKSVFVPIEKQGHMVTFLHPKTSESMFEYLQTQLAR